MCSKSRVCEYRFDAFVTLRNPNLNQSWPHLIAHRYPGAEQTDSKKALYQWWTQGLGFGGHVEQRHVSGPSGPSIVYEYTLMISEGDLRRALPCWYLEPFGHATPDHVKLSNEQASIGYTVHQLVIGLFILFPVTLFLWFCFIMMLRQTLGGHMQFDAFVYECRNCICECECDRVCDREQYAELTSPAAPAARSVQGR